MVAIRAGQDAWRQFDATAAGWTIQDTYNERWSLYTGSAFTRMARNTRVADDPRVYNDIALVWKHHTSVVDFYATTVYQGDLSTDGETLPDGTRGAIPLDPQTGSPEQDAVVRRAVAELWSAWNWRQNMSLRPMYAAALGDVLTELIDDPAAGMVYPAIVWPGYVTDIALDYVGNVKSYTVEYQAEEVLASGGVERYLMRREMSGEAFRYFRNGKPHAYFGAGTEVIPNPYGFVPAIWDRHRVIWGERGAAATDTTRQAVIRLNSLLTHGMDFQQKAFAMPIIVRGQLTAPGQTRVELGRPPKLRGEGPGQAETSHWLQANGDVELVQPTMDIGQTLAIIDRLIDGIERENPEATFYPQIRQMSQVTAPGVERALGDAVNRCRMVRAGQDGNSVKLFQMALTMCGMRANLPEAEGGWPRTVPGAGARRLTRRQEVFLPFTLESFKAGEMDFGISDRPVVSPTESERIDLIRQKEALQTAWGLEQVGLSEEDARRVLDGKSEARSSAFNIGGFA